MKANGNALFDVVIFDMESGKVESIVGTNLFRDRGTYNAERRLESAFSRINLDRYSAEIVPAGSHKVGSIMQVNAERESHESRTEEDKREDDMDRQRAYPERRP